MLRLGKYAAWFLGAFLLLWLPTACRPSNKSESDGGGVTGSVPVKLPDDFSAGGPYGGRITNLFSDGEYLYVSSWHMGVYRSPDGGQWREFNQGMTGYKDVLTFSGSRGVYYAGTFQGELFQRHGTSDWRLLKNYGDGREGAIHAIAVNDKQVFVAIGGGLDYSEDTGATWVRLFGDAEVMGVVHEASFPNPIVFGTISGGMHACQRMLGRCRPMQLPTKGQRIAAVVSGATILPMVYIAVENDGVYSMTDGQHFSRFDLPLEAPEPVVIAASSNGIAVSLENFGLVYQPSSTGGWRKIPFPKTITALCYHQGNLYFGTDGLGVFRVDGERYTALNKGILNFPEEMVTDYLKTAPRQKQP